MMSQSFSRCFFCSFDGKAFNHLRRLVHNIFIFVFFQNQELRKIRAAHVSTIALKTKSDAVVLAFACVSKREGKRAAPD